MLVGSLLYEVNAFDPVVFLAAPLLLAAASLAACYLPALPRHAHPADRGAQDGVADGSRLSALGDSDSAAAPEGCARAQSREP